MLVPITPLQTERPAAKRKTINDVIERANLLAGIRVSDGLSLAAAPTKAPGLSGATLTAEVSPSLVVSDLIVGGGDSDEDTPSLWRVDVDGNIVWQTNAGAIYSIEICPGEYLTENTIYVLTSSDEPNPPNSHLVLQKYTEDGEFVWETADIFHLGEYISSRCIALDNAEKIYVVGLHVDAGLFGVKKFSDDGDTVSLVWEEGTNQDMFQEGRGIIHSRNSDMFWATHARELDPWGDDYDVMRFSPTHANVWRTYTHIGTEGTRAITICQKYIFASVIDGIDGDANVRIKRLQVASGFWWAEMSGVGEIYNLETKDNYIFAATAYTDEGNGSKNLYKIFFDSAYGVDLSIVRSLLSAAEIDGSFIFNDDYGCLRFSDSADALHTMDAGFVSQWARQIQGYPIRCVAKPFTNEFWPRA